MNLNQVTLFVMNLSRSIDFYETLGLRLIVKDKHYARFLCPKGNSTLSLHLTEQSLQSLSTGVVIYFECDELDEVVTALKNRGITFERDPIDQDWLWREAYLLDPNGHTICLYYAGENRINPPWRINQS